jgi:succinoglycan biosynthesis protein ExoO
MPYVSVIIPVYNAADFVTDAYQSIVDQTIDDWEIIFVNDASQDDTLSRVRSLAMADSRIKVLDLASKSGPACARNAALAVAEGDWIAVLDADDAYSRDRLEVLTLAAERSAADIVLDNQFVVDPISWSTYFLAFEPSRDELTGLQFSDFLRNVQSNSFFDFGYLQPIIKRRWLTANNIKYSEQLRLGEDIMLLFECYARRPNVILLSQPYYYYRFQFSELNRTKSPTTRTEVRYEPLLAATEQYLETYRSKLSRTETRLIASRCESLREAIMVSTLRTCLKTSDIVGLVRHMRHPIRVFRGIYFEKRRRFLIKRRTKMFPLNDNHQAGSADRNPPGCSPDAISTPHRTC